MDQGDILYPPRFRKELDTADGGFVFYPWMQGQHWAFQASKMAGFLDRRFGQFLSRRRRLMVWRKAKWNARWKSVENDDSTESWITRVKLEERLFVCSDDSIHIKHIF